MRLIHAQPFKLSNCQVIEITLTCDKKKIEINQVGNKKWDS